VSATNIAEKISLSVGRLDHWLFMLTEMMHAHAGDVDGSTLDVHTQSARLFVDAALDDVEELLNVLMHGERTEETGVRPVAPRGRRVRKQKKPARRAVGK
jgi:hypothetical protein